jgi:anti-sigma regulatory factor (Ser/Thr protein kinase)
VGYLEKGIPARRLIDEVVAVAGLLETVEGALAEDRVKLTSETHAPRAARRFVDETLRRWECSDALETIELLVSELVTNAVVHARSEPEVAVILHRDVIRVEVTDASPAQPERRSPDVYEPSGRGLGLVEKLAMAWGVDAADGGGKVVWFELPRLDAPTERVVIR